MKKKTEKLIQEKFLKLLESKTIDEIDINMICNSLKIKRQTFYYHYKNIYDVILSFYFNDEIKVKNKSFSNIISSVIDYLFLKEDFNKEVIKSNAKDILNEFVYSNIYKNTLNYLKKYNLNLIQRKEEAVFISHSLTDYIIYLFDKEEDEQVEMLEKVEALMNEDIIENITSSYITSLKSIK